MRTVVRSSQGRRPKPKPLTRRLNTKGTAQKTRVPSPLPSSVTSLFISCLHTPPSSTPSISCSTPSTLSSDSDSDSPKWIYNEAKDGPIIEEYEGPSEDDDDEDAKTTVARDREQMTADDDEVSDSDTIPYTDASAPAMEPDNDEETEDELQTNTIIDELHQLTAIIEPNPSLLQKPFVNVEKLEHQRSMPPSHAMIKPLPTYSPFYYVSDDEDDVLAPSDFRHRRKYHSDALMIHLVNVLGLLEEREDYVPPRKRARKSKWRAKTRKYLSL